MMNEQTIDPAKLEGIWNCASWRTLYANFHPEMEPEEATDSWKEIEIDKESPTSEIMEVLFKSRSKFSNSSLVLSNNVKTGPWLEANFRIGNESKAGWWEYNKDENIISFMVEGYGYNLYFHIKKLSENEMIVIEKLYKTESDAYFNYITMKREK